MTQEKQTIRMQVLILLRGLLELGNQVGITYTFTKDDIIYQAGGTKLSNKEEVALLKKGDEEVSVKESLTDTSYTAEFKFSAATYIFSFTKTSATQIESTGILDGTYVKQ